MIHLVCSVFDSKVGAYAPPFYAPTKGSAIRSFSDACKDKDHAFARHPSDYRLFLLGEFDDNSGRFTSADSPVPLIGADELD